MRARRIRTGRASVLLAALALAFAGCGGGDEAPEDAPALPRPLAERLAAQSEGVADALAAGDTQGASERAERLRNEVIEAINEGRVPPELQEELTQAVNLLADDVARSAPPPPPPTTTGTTTGETTTEEEEDDD